MLKSLSRPVFSLSDNNEYKQMEKNSICPCNNVKGNRSNVAFMDNVIYVIERSENMLFQTLVNAYASVDTFFVMSGCLVMLGTLRALDRFKGLCKKLFLVLKYIQFSFTFASVLLLILFSHEQNFALLSDNKLRVFCCDNESCSLLRIGTNYYILLIYKRWCNLQRGIINYGGRIVSKGWRLIESLLWFVAIQAKLMGH